VHKIAVLADANVTPPERLEELQQAAQSRGVEALVRAVAKPDDVISVINDVKASGAQAINFCSTPMFSLGPKYPDFVATARVIICSSHHEHAATGSNC
jgi:hypothetical protein